MSSFPQGFKIASQFADARIEWFDVPVGPRLHEAALHDREDEAGGLVRPRHVRGTKARFDRVFPRGKIPGDRFVRRRVLGIDLERQPTDRTAVATPGGEKPLAVSIEQSENAFDRIGGLFPRGANDMGLEERHVGDENGPQQRILTVEKMIEAAAVRAGTVENLGEARRAVAFFPEEM